MKKRKIRFKTTKNLEVKGILLLIVTLMAFMLYGCKNQEIEEPKELQTGYGKMLQTSINIYENVIKTVSKYIDIEESNSRSSYKEKSVSQFFKDLGNKLPEDLSTLKRIDDNVTSRSGEVKEISLQEELEHLSTQYIQSLKENLPDLTVLKKLEGVEIIDGSIYLSNGMRLQLDTPQGIAACEYLIAVAETGSGEEAIKKIEQDIQTIEIEKSEFTSSRGLYFTNSILGYGDTWDDGIVYYRWGSIYESHKTELINAMADWEAKVNTGSTKIQFKELEDNGWNNFCLVIGTMHVTTFKTGELDAGTMGQTNTIGQPYFGTLILSDILTSDQLIRTTRHELGHVLGLMHEHQRADRDNYIIVPDVDITWENFINDINQRYNYGKVPEYLGGLVWKVKTIKGKWLTIKIPYLAWDNKATHLTTLVGEFDFKSIMLYKGFEIKDTEMGKKYGRYDSNINNYVTDYNKAISAQDIQAVQQMY